MNGNELTIYEAGVIPAEVPEGHSARSILLAVLLAAALIFLEPRALVLLPLFWAVGFLAYLMRGAEHNGSLGEGFVQASYDLVLDPFLECHVDGNHTVTFMVLFVLTVYAVVGQSLHGYSMWWAATPVLVYVGTWATIVVGFFVVCFLVAPEMEIE